MRTVALITNGPPGFTWFGSLVIAVSYIAALLPGAIALAYTARRWPWILFGGGIAFLADAPGDVSPARWPYLY